MNSSSNATENSREFMLPSKSMSVIEQQKKKALRERAKVTRSYVGDFDDSNLNITDSETETEDYCENGADSCRSETSFVSRMSDCSRKSAYRRTPNVVATGHRSQSGAHQNLGRSDLKELKGGAGGDMPEHQVKCPKNEIEEQVSNKLPVSTVSAHEVYSAKNEKRPNSSRSHKTFDVPATENSSRGFTFSCHGTPKFIPRNSSQCKKSSDRVIKSQIDDGNIKDGIPGYEILNNFRAVNAALSASSLATFTSEENDMNMFVFRGELDEKSIPENEDSDDTVTEEDSKCTKIKLTETNSSTTSQKSLYPTLEVVDEFSPELEKPDSNSNSDEKSESSEDGAQVRPQTAASQFSIKYPTKSDYGFPEAKVKSPFRLGYSKSIENSQKIDKSTYDHIMGLFLDQENPNVDDEQNCNLQKFKREFMLTDKFYNMEQTKNEIQYKLAPNHIMDNLEEFALHPVPPGFFMKCRIIRDKKGIDKTVFPYYYLQLERDDGRKNLLMVSRKKKKSTTSYYVITTDPSSTNSVLYTGKLRSNLLGTNFTVYDNQLSYKQFRCLENMNPRESKLSLCREELAMVFYATNVLGFKGPRKMEVVIPKMLNHAARAENRPRQKSLKMIEKIKKNDMTKLHCLKNKTPVWNADNQSYVLNFHGRVTHASVKNFKLVTKDSDGYCALQFGRIAEDVFNLDFGYPLCPLQAFAVVLSSFDSKLACE